MTVSDLDRVAMRRGLDQPPVLTFAWQDAVFEHYRITDVARVARRLPSPLALDRHQGDAYLSVVSVRVRDQRLGGRVPTPGARDYVQVNIRTYVRSPDKAGIFFLRSFASTRTAALLGRLGYGVPNRHREARFQRVGDARGYCTPVDSRRQHRVSGRIGARLTGHELDPSSLRFFLVERYAQFTAPLGGGVVLEAMVRHRPWPLHRLELTVTDDVLLDELGLAGAVEPAAEAHYASGVAAELWRPYRLGGAPLPRVRPAFAATGA